MAKFQYVEWSSGHLWMEQPETLQFSEKPVIAVVRQALSQRGQEAGLAQRLKKFWHWWTAMLVSELLRPWDYFLNLLVINLI